MAENGTEKNDDDRHDGPAPSPPPEAEKDSSTLGEDHEAEKPNPADRPDSAARKDGECIERRMGRSSEVVNNFYGHVHVSDGTIGVAGAGDGDRRRAVTGRLDEDEIRQILRHHIRPAAHERAAEKLAEQRVVVLTGPHGIGKRSGAMALLREAASGKLAVLSPASDLSTLAERPYRTGWGYLITDWFAGDRALRASERDFSWSAVRDQVAEARAYLIVTTLPSAFAIDSHAVAHVAWECPPITELLRRRVAGAVPDGAVERAAALVPEDYAIADAVRIADRLAREEEAERAVAEVLERSGRKEVHQWFETEPTREEIVDVTALALAPGVRERDFETLSGRLAKELATTMPPPAATALDPEQTMVPGKDVLGQRRSLRGSMEGLIRVERRTQEGTGRRYPVFREDGYRSEVLTQLWERFDISFWDGVRAWMTGIMDEGGYAVNVAAGLAALARIDLDEVQEMYLDPWSKDGSAWHAQVAAVYLLWTMCRDDEQAAEALRIAVRWISYGSNAQRELGTLAFTGELGVRYPTEAVRRLWQLASQENALSTDAAIALGGLFGTLAMRGRSAGEVVRQLRVQFSRTRPVGPTRGRRVLILHAVLVLLSGRDPHTGIPAVVIHLDARPGQVQPIVELWAALIRYRPLRHAGLTELWRAVNAFHQVTSEPEPAVRALGEAFARVLPLAEHTGFRASLIRIAEGERPDRAARASAIETLLAALKKAHVRSHGEKE
ncbi:nSTAND3 domain-containing NTPase [Allosalinactinospora lopnorensis]|uniref:nSTAND3 domain-containing NTPase n=1 Tax=Allosalinactinospora lopnorensis TaxID=1352348 RepID=UPI000623EF2D|nr:hypothetical protein [Allosalinactinospora lopnorensis]